MVQDPQDFWHSERRFDIRHTPTIGNYVNRESDEYVFETVVDYVERVITARDNFFEWTRSGKANMEATPASTPCLWGYFGTWIAEHWIYDLHGEKPIWLNPARREEVWAEFLPIVPLIYLAIIDEALLDPSKLDFIPRENAFVPSTCGVLPSWKFMKAADPRITPKNRQYEPLVQLILGGDGAWPPLVAQM